MLHRRGLYWWGYSLLLKGNLERLVGIFPPINLKCAVSLNHFQSIRQFRVLSNSQNVIDAHSWRMRLLHGCCLGCNSNVSLSVCYKEFRAYVWCSYNSLRFWGKCFTERQLGVCNGNPSHGSCQITSGFYVAFTWHIPSDMGNASDREPNETNLTHSVSHVSQRQYNTGNYINHCSFYSPLTANSCMGCRARDPENCNCIKQSIVQLLQIKYSCSIFQPYHYLTTIALFQIIWWLFWIQEQRRHLH